MTPRFNPAPGWPSAPEGWTPPPGWTPEPHWPAPPPGWQLWVEDGPERFAQPGAAVVPVARVDGAVLAPAAPTPGTLPPGGGWGADQQTNQEQAVPWQDRHDPFSTVPPEPTKPRRGWVIPVGIGVVGCLVIAGVLFAAGVFGGSDDSKEEATAAPTETSTAKPTATSTADPKPTATSTADPKPTDSPTAKHDPTNTATDDPAASAPAPVGETGSRDAPLAVGTTVVLEDWEVSLGASDTDAWKTVKSTLDRSYQEVYAPADGTQWVMAPAEVTYRGAGSASSSSVRWAYISKSGVAYADQCMVPGQTRFGAELYAGGSVAANTCVEVLAADADGGVWRVSGYTSSYKETQAFFASS